MPMVLTAVYFAMQTTLENLAQKEPCSIPEGGIQLLAMTEQSLTLLHKHTETALQCILSKDKQVYPLTL